MCPKILVISHNMFNYTDNMGKTLNNMFDGWERDKLAQLSFCDELPSAEVCDNYYRITDLQALKSVLTGKHYGDKLYLSDGNKRAATQQKTSKNTFVKKIYIYIKKKNQFIWRLRNAIWSYSKWNSKELRAWLDEFNPDAVFFASGNYAFSYNIAHTIASDRNIPLITYSCDDYYLNGPLSNARVIERNRKYFMSAVEECIEYSSAVITICDKMASAYKQLFGGKKIYTLNTNAVQKYVRYDKINKISYVGNVSLGRAEQLAQIGRALKSIDEPNKPNYIDVYSSTQDPKAVGFLTKQNGIDFHGAIGKDEALKTISESVAVIHTESFDEAMVRRSKYSISTKIPDSLAIGTCIFAYGPEAVASIEYLKQNEAALVVTSSDNLKSGLKELLQNKELREFYERNAKALANKNHNLKNNQELLKNIFEEALSGGNLK